MSELFQVIENQYKLSPTPIILIDISGSTGDNFKGKLTVRDYEFSVAHKMCVKLGYSQAHIITWSSVADLNIGVPIDNIEQIRRSTSSNGGTQLMSALNCIEDKLFVPDTMTEIIIITDGEVQDQMEEVVKGFTDIMKHNIQIKIIAVEPNDKDYLVSDAKVGNQLYKIIRNGQLTRLVERFSVFNRREEEFINLSNPSVKTGYLPFDGLMFPVAKFNQFVQLIKEEITYIMRTPTETMSVNMLQLIQNLSVTIYNHTKKMTYTNQLMIVDLFSNILKGTRFYSDMRSLLLSEVNNHMTGKTSTFSEIKKAKYTKMENSIMDLIMDTQRAVCQTPCDFNYSFPLMDHKGGHYVIKSYDKQFGQIKINSSFYNNSGINIGNYMIPMLFGPSGASSSALYWIKMIYGNRLNISPSNEHIYYYILCDAYNMKNTEVSDVYDKYVDLVMNDCKYNTDVTIAQDITNSNMINIPYGVQQDAVKKCGYSVKPSTLYYTICHHYLMKYVGNKQPVLDNLRGFCEKDLKLDGITYTSIETFGLPTEVRVIDINHGSTVLLKKHKYLGDIDCPNTTSTTPTDITAGTCHLCNSMVESINIIQNSVFGDIDYIVESNVYDTRQHIHLGFLSGIPDETLISPDRFDTEYKSMSLDNQIIIDPISTSCLKIKTQEEFTESVNIKYPFIKQINMTNIALCGGFGRSVLLKQQMKDFDFFFYGLSTEQEYIERVKLLVSDIIRNVRKANEMDNKFAFFYKPQFNVIEMICYEDPKNHIREDFTLDYFDQYKFKSMKKYKPNRGEPREKLDKESKKYYFEDNDEHGVKMKYRFQLVLCQYNIILDIFKSFDMFPSMVGYDGKRVYFTQKSLIAYQYMINEINVKGGTDMAKHRINKYFKYGFSIVFPQSTRNWNGTDYENDYTQENVSYKGTNENLGPLKFKVRQVIGNVVYVNHNSNIEQILKRNEKLEKKAKKHGTALYTSSLFCSFVAVLRYIKINNINYLFPIGDTINQMFDGNAIKLKNGAEKMSFFTEQKSIYKTTDWYDVFAKSIIFNKYIE